MDNTKYRTGWRRVWAGLADGIVFMPLAAVDTWIWTVAATPLLLVPWYLCYSFSMLAYSVLLHWRRGQTLGKRLFGVRVVSLPGDSLTFRQAALRDVVPLALCTAGVILDLPSVVRGQNPYAEAAIAASAVSPLHLFVLWSSGLWFLLEVATMLSNARRRALHDFIASTVVVRSRLSSSDTGA